jgi:uncharacterized protein (DUF983 family)
MRWEPDRSAPALTHAAPDSFWTAVRRGAAGLCPCCGKGRLFDGYLKFQGECSNCGAPLGLIRADDAPPYFTILIAGHLLVPPVLWIEKAYQPAMWIHMVTWLPLFTLACILLLRPIKGATAGWMLKLGITGAEHGPPPPEGPR